jgi:UPF0716 protein FxsA
MHLFFCLALLLIGLPAIELVCFAVLGGQIGLLPTLLIIFGTGLIGAFLARQEGLRAWQKVHLALAEGRNPSRQVLNGLAILIAGLALLLPGFFTDLVGLFLLFAPTRRLAIALVLHFFPGLRPLTGDHPQTGARTDSDLDAPPAPRASDLIIDVTPHDVRDAEPKP